MSKFKKIDEKASFSRRTLLKGFCAASASCALAGCATGDGEKDWFEDPYDGAVPPSPEIEGKTLYGATPHNCGGGCLSKYYVENGVVKRIVTDEDRPDGDIYEGKAQMRSCVRCRSRREWWYRNDRLKYPLKRPDGVNRGDVKNYIRISWDEAVREIAARQTAALESTGFDPRTVVVTYGLGDRTFQTTYMKRGITANCKYGTKPFCQDLSYPQWMFTNWFVDYEVPLPSFSGMRFQYRMANGRKDIKNSDNLILWSVNPAETRLGVNTCNYIDRAKEENPNLKVTVIDPRYTRTAEVYADSYVAPAAATDAALVLAIIYEILVSAWDASGAWIAGDTNLLLQAWKNHEKFDDSEFLNGASTDEEKVVAFIKKYMHGFFDMPSSGPAGYGVDYYTSDMLQAFAADPNAYIVPAGASVSAYVMGADDRLVNAGINGGVSIYPETIGYNVNTDDPLYGKTVPCYGKVPKTSLWAESITGVKTETIKEFARMYCTTKVTAWHGAGVQRTTEGEQFCWLLPILHTLTGQFGTAGRSYGFCMELDAKAPGTEYSSNPQPYSYTDAQGNPSTSEQSGIMTDLVFAEFFDLSKVTLRGTLTGQVQSNRIVPMLGSSMTMSSIPVFAWSDVVMNGGRNTSKWNIGKVKNTGTLVQNTAINPEGTPESGKTKIVWSLGGNSVTQAGNAAFGTEALSRDDITFIACDIFMTPTVKLADYILPARAAGEKWGITDSWLSSESVIMQPVSEPPTEECLSEFEIGRRFAKAFGNEEGYKTIDDSDSGRHVLNNDEELARYYWKQFQIAHSSYMTSAAYKLTFDEFRDRGYYSTREVYGSSAALAAITVDNIARSHFRADPAGSTVASFVGSPVPLAALMTATGKVEAYCQSMVEDYEASHNDNIDNSTKTDGSDPLGGPIYTKGTPFGHQDASKRRYVYPVPMFIPCVEGRFADGNHPDPLGLSGEGYNFIAQSYHENYRAHSVLNNVAYLDELYKKDADGNPAYLDAGRDCQMGAWDDGVYEPAFINPCHGAEYGVTDGDIILVESKWGKIYASVVLSNRIAPYSVGIGEGAWYEPDEDGVDKGGCVNTLFSGRPSRIGFGMTLGSDARVRISKAARR